MKDNPLTTIFLFSYNQEKFISEAVSSILAQTYEPLQIIISDDCSCDRTYSLASKLVEEYDGPHRVLLNKNEKNLGIGKHVNRVMELAEGEIVVAAGGDDISLPERVSDIIEAWKNEGKIYLSMCSDMLTINEIGTPVNQLPIMKPITFDKVLHSKTRWMNGATHAWHKSLFEIFGPLREDVVSEDKVIGFRSLLLGQKIGYIEKILVKYRSHVGNVTSGSTNLATLWQKISTFKSYIEDFEKAKSLGYIKESGGMDETYQELIQIHSDFTLRHKILSSGLIKAIILLMTSGSKLSVHQKTNLLVRKIKGLEKKVGW